MKHHSTNKSIFIIFLLIPSRQALFLHCLLETCPAPTPHLQNLLSHLPVFYFRLYGRFYICLWEFLPILLRSLTIRVSFWHSAHILSSYFLTLCGASFWFVKLSARIFLAVASDPANYHYDCTFSQNKANRCLSADSLSVLVYFRSNTEFCSLPSKLSIFSAFHS